MTDPVTRLHLPKGAGADLFGPGNQVKRDVHLDRHRFAPRTKCVLRASGSYEFPLGDGWWAIAGGAEVLAEHASGALHPITSGNHDQAQRLRALIERLHEDRMTQAMDDAEQSEAHPEPEPTLEELEEMRIRMAHHRRVMRIHATTSGSRRLAVLAKANEDLMRALADLEPRRRAA